MNDGRPLYNIISGFLLVATLSRCTTSGPTPLTFPDGGYKYSASVGTDDSSFAALPLKDSFEQKDSLLWAEEGVYTLASFDETNISLRPLDNPVFRLIYDGFSSPPHMIIVSDGQIIVKEGIKGEMIPYHDINLLTGIDKEHYFMLRSHFPIPESLHKQKPGERRFLDSMLRRYPELLQPEYYLSLRKKCAVWDSLQYTVRKIRISNRTYRRWVNGLNASGYWKMPVQLPHCGDTDGDGFIFEANTPKQYNLVVSPNCDGKTKFAEVMRQLVEMAGLEKKIYMARQNSKEDHSPDTMTVRDVIIQRVPPEKEH